MKKTKNAYGQHIIKAIALTLIGVLLFAFIFTPFIPKLIHTPYDFNTVYEKPGWAEINSTQLRTFYCQVPPPTLILMDTDALVQTIAEFPFLHNTALFGDLGVKLDQHNHGAMYHDFNGIRELERRLDGRDAITAFLAANPDLPRYQKEALENILAYGHFTSIQNVLLKTLLKIAIVAACLLIIQKNTANKINPAEQKEAGKNS